MILIAVCEVLYFRIKVPLFTDGKKIFENKGTSFCFLQFYLKEGANQLAKQAFDCARSIDPSLSLPWAGMAADFHARYF